MPERNGNDIPPQLTAGRYPERRQLAEAVATPMGALLEVGATRRGGLHGPRHSGARSVPRCRSSSRDRPAPPRLPAQHHPTDPPLIQHATVLSPSRTPVGRGLQAAVRRSPAQLSAAWRLAVPPVELGDRPACNANVSGRRDATDPEGVAAFGKVVEHKHVR